MTALAIAERALSFVSDGEAEVYVGTESWGLARYAGSEIHQPTLVDNAGVQLRVISGRRSGVATTNRTDDKGLAELARRAADVVANASDDPELVPPAPPVELPDAEGYDEETAALGAAGQARLAGAACAEAAGDLKLYGYFTSGAVADGAAHDRCDLPRAGGRGRCLRVRDSDGVASRRDRPRRGRARGAGEGGANARRPRA